MKKIVILALVVAMAFGLSLGLNACKHKHELGEWIDQVNATCTEDGVVGHYHCEDCGADLDADGNQLESIVIAKTGHTPQKVDSVDATCTQNGLTEGEVCQTCGQELTAQDVIQATGHKWDSGTVTTQPRCDAEGVMTFTCDVCGDTKTESIEKTLHNFGEWIDEVEPTCSQPGVKAHKTCSICGKNYDESDVEIADLAIETIAHTPQNVDGKPATCTETGLTQGQICLVCGKTLVEQEVIPVVAHTWDNGEVTIESTCDAVGEMSYKCLVCGETKTEDIDMVAHTFGEWIDQVDPTCTQNGTKAHKACTVCGNNFDEDDSEIASLVIDKIPHTPQVVSAVDPTCTETGLTEGSKCSVCGEILVEQEVAAALGHDWDEGRWTAYPTCTAEGEKLHTCSRCDQTKRESVDKLAHIFFDGWVEEVAATCAEEGVKAHQYCTSCNKYYDENEIEITNLTIDKLPHTPETVKGYEATCGTAGLTDGEACLECGQTLVEQTEISMLPEHTWNNGEVTVAVKCYAAGEMLYTCQVCQATKVETIEVIPHTPETVAGKPATCKDSGLTSGEICSVCGAVIKEQTVIAPTPARHVFSDLIAAVPASCANGIAAHYECQVCGELLSEYNQSVTWQDLIIPANGVHQFDLEVPEIAATCHTEGQKAYKHCAKCDKNYDEDGVQLTDLSIPTIDHSWDEGKIVAEATCSETGLIHYTCTVCDATQDEILSKLPHTVQVVVGVKPNCTEGGISDGSVCTVCGETLVEQQELPALGHTEQAIIGRIATCTETGLTDGIVCLVCGEILLEQSVIDTVAHTEEVIPTVDATCIAKGLTGGLRCSVCGLILEAQQETDTIDHVWVEGEIIKQHTCTEDGLQVIVCEVCGLVKEVVTVEPAHTPEVVEGREATCTEAGLTEGSICSVCGEVLAEQEEISATDHDWNDWHVDDETGGEQRDCAICGKVEQRYEEIPDESDTPIDEIL